MRFTFVVLFTLAIVVKILRHYHINLLNDWGTIHCVYYLWDFNLSNFICLSLVVIFIKVNLVIFVI